MLADQLDGQVESNRLTLAAQKICAQCNPACISRFSYEGDVDVCVDCGKPLKSRFPSMDKSFSKAKVKVEEEARRQREPEEEPE